MKVEEKRFHQYSLSFYQKEKELNNVTNRVKIGFSHFDRNEKLLKPQTIQAFIKFTDHYKKGQKELLQEDSETYMSALFEVVKSLSSDRDLMEYVLPTIDAILTEERQVLREVVEDVKTGKYSGVLTTLKSFLAIEDHRDVTYMAAARVASIILGELPKQLFFNQQKSFLLQLLAIRKNSLKQKISDYGLVTCFVQLNKHSQLAELFLQNGGMALLMDSLTKSGNDIQLIYYSLLNVWMVSFLEAGVDRFLAIAKFGIIKAICQVLQKVSRQKITRIAFVIFKNIDYSHPCLQLMMDNRLLKIIDTILKGNIKDQELIDSIKEVGAILESNIRSLSSFDKYVKEINTDMLEWSSVHNESFWKENAIKFEANDYQIIKKLKFLLNSKRSLNVAIACYDLGEFCRFYPRGKAVIQSQQIKDMIMERARYSQDKSVREQALLALQKIMIQNWQAI